MRKIVKNVKCKCKNVIITPHRQVGADGLAGAVGRRQDDKHLQSDNLGFRVRMIDQNRTIAQNGGLTATFGTSLPHNTADVPMWG